jgi:hypothetical protein
LGERYEGYFGKVVDSFEANTGSKYELYNPKEMAIRFPMIDMGQKIWGCYDPSAGILMADKCLKLLWVRIKMKYSKRSSYIALSYTGLADARFLIGYNKI